MAAVVPAPFHSGGKKSVTRCLEEPSDVRHADTLVTLTRQVADMLIASFERAQSRASVFFQVANDGVATA